MKPEQRSQTLLGVARAKAKMYEYRVPDQYHIAISRDPAQLFTLSLALLGDLAAYINSSAPEPTRLAELKDSLRFSAQFFDAYRQAQLDQKLDSYLLLLGSASYYLCDLPGSSAVLAKRLPTILPDLGGLGLERLMAWLLVADFLTPPKNTAGIYENHIAAVSSWLSEYFKTGARETHLMSLTDRLKTTAYENGDPRQLLFADVSCALARTRRHNSTWYSLPRYSKHSAESWRPALQKASFMRELWPAQRLLGESGLFNGKSGVVQFPTSAGKTRATELIIRSEFLADRTDLAIVVAPFRALCHEIRNSLVKAFDGEQVNVDELSDVFQTDFNIAALLAGKQVIVVTPEKLVYVLRHNSELAPKIGLLIYDEGHQFDNGTRGVTYELLVTSLKAFVPERAQTVLISAVITNAHEINTWLNGDNSVVVSGTTLGPTYRSVAFTSWPDQLGRLQFVAENNPDKDEFFVPRVIEQSVLENKPREYKLRTFPDRKDGPSIALYLGLKLVPSGSVALFCGTKPAAAHICERAVDLFDRGVPLEKPVNHSDRNEVQRLCFLHESNLGKDAIASQSAR